MQNQKTIRQSIEQLFVLPAMKMPWSLYLAQLNEAGKMTARSVMDILTVVLETLEQIEENIKDTKLLIESQESAQTLTQTISSEPVEMEVELPLKSDDKSQISLETPLPSFVEEVSIPQVQKVETITPILPKEEKIEEPKEMPVLELNHPIEEKPQEPTI